MTAPIIIGIDPGRSAAVAAVRVPANGRPILLGAWNVFGSKHKSSAERAWSRSLDVCLQELGELAPMVARIWVEDPPADGKTKKKARGNPFAKGGRMGSTRGPDFLLRLGRFQGELIRGFRTMYGMDPLLLPQDEWARELRLPDGKRMPPFASTPRGWHRCAEAAHHVEGYQQPPAAKDDNAGERLVAIAEAVLIAACGAQRWRAQ